MTDDIRDDITEIRERLARLETKVTYAGPLFLLLGTVLGAAVTRFLLGA